MGAAGGATAAAAAAAIAEATKASGVIVRVNPSGFLSTHYQYLTSYKGLAFFTQSENPIGLPASAELVHAEKIWIPG